MALGEMMEIPSQFPLSTCYRHEDYRSSPSDSAVDAKPGRFGNYSVVGGHVAGFTLAAVNFQATEGRNCQ